MNRPIYQQIKNKQTFRQRLVHRIKALRELEIINQSNLTYSDAQYLLNGKWIKQRVITLILKNIYKDRFQNLNNDWKNTISDDMLIEDVFVIKRKAIEQQWISENIDQQRVKQKEQKFEQYVTRAKNQKQMKERLKSLRDQMNIIAGKIEMAKKQDQSIQLTQKYSELKKEEAFLKNKNRRLKSLVQEKNSIVLEKSSSSMIIQLQNKIGQLSMEIGKNQLIQDLNCKSDDNDQKTLMSKNEQQGKYRIKKLEQIFKSYAKKQCKETMLFQQMRTVQSFISLQNFLRMIGQSGIDSLLTLQQRVTIFKSNSNYDKRINFTGFINALRQISFKNCQKLNVSFQSRILDMLLDQFVKKVQSNYRYNKQQKSNLFEKKNTGCLRLKQLSKYQHKLRSHTGKTVHSIVQDLQERKKIKQSRMMMLKSKIKCQQNQLNRNHNNITLKSSLPLTNQHNSTNLSKKITPRLKSLQSQTQAQKNTFLSYSSHKNTYASIFQRQRSNKHKQQNIYSVMKANSNTSDDTNKSQILQLHSQSLKTNLKQFSPIGILRKQTMQPQDVRKSQPENQDLKQLINYYEDDTFLTSHLDRNSAAMQGQVNKSKMPRFHF